MHPIRVARAIALPILLGTIVFAAVLAITRCAVGTEHPTNEQPAALAAPTKGDG